MSAIPGQGEIACRFAKALGLDPRKIKNIHLSVIPDEPIMVSVEMFVQETELNDLGLELKQFELVEKEQPKKEDTWQEFVRDYPKGVHSPSVDNTKEPPRKKKEKFPFQCMVCGYEFAEMKVPCPHCWCDGVLRKDKIKA